MTTIRSAAAASRRVSSRRRARSATGSLTEDAYRELKRRILICELEPGASITEAQTGQLLGIGKTPVREALARLVQEGLVKNIPRHGYQITPITLKYVQELFGLRLIVEPTAVELAAGRIDAARLRRLNELSEIDYLPGDPDSASLALEQNREFHVAVARASGNDRLAELVGNLLAESQRLMLVSMLARDRGQRITHSHRELIDVLLAGNAQLARQLTFDQIMAVQRLVVEALLWRPPIGASIATPPSLHITA